MDELTVTKPSDSKMLRSIRDKFIPEKGQAYYLSFLSQLATRLEREAADGKANTADN